jgi:hypothetical protein
MNAQIEHNFKYHAPTGDAVQAHTEIRAAAKMLAVLIDEALPAAAGREKALAITKVEEAMMWACAGVARHAGSTREPSIAEKMKDVSAIIIGVDGRCACTCEDPCPLGKTGPDRRCTEAEVKAVNFPTNKISG